MNTSSHGPKSPRGAATYQDLRLGLRAFGKTPVVSVLMVVTLALGIAATTAIFSVMNVLLLRPVAGVRDQTRLVSVERAQPQGIEVGFSYPDYRDLSERVHLLDLAGFRRTALDLRGNTGTSRRVTGALVTDTYFPVLGVQAAIGRLLGAADARADVAVISDACWRRHFSADPDILGKGVTINGHTFTIVGIAAPEFEGTFPGEADAVWLPIATQPVVLPRMSVGVLENRNSRWIRIIGRLTPSARRVSAEAEIVAVDEALAQAFPSSHAGRVRLASSLGLSSDDRSELRLLMSVLIVGACLVLLVACGNVSNLLLTRAETRRREIATRRALGASDTRIAGQLVVEGLLLALAGGGGGFWLAPYVIVTVSGLTKSAYGVGADALRPDMRVLAFALLVSMTVAVAFTIVPFSHARRTHLVDALKEGGRGAAGRTTRLRATLVVVQVALSVMLLIGAGLSLRTMQQIRAVSPGYATGGIVLASFALDLQGYSGPAAARFFDTLAADLRNTPGTRAVSWATAIPPVAFGGRRSVFHVGEAPPQAELQQREEELGIRADAAHVGPDFFHTMSIALTHGRGFTEQDRVGTQAVAIVNEALAEQLWPAQNAVGRYLEAPPYSGTAPGPMQIVGIARNTRHRSLMSTASVPVLYLPFLQNPDARATVALQSTIGAAAFEMQIRQLAAAIDPNVAVAAIQDFDQYVAATLWEQHTAARMFAMFGILALFLSATGLYAIVSHAVASRTREIGIRLALGSSPVRLLRAELTRALRYIGLGLVFGLAAAAVLTPLVGAFLFQVQPHDAVVYAAAAAALVATGIVAAIVPARRAMRVDPLIALRTE
jgi:putative ABC transport system permease protein